jgi:adenosylcobinamide kinase/adenosylcobinamide-phosphate guanylyltransferase
MGRLILVTGGARSGKSTYALERAEEISQDRSFLATCPVLDGEMRQRIEKHRREREGRGWRCCEEEISIAARIAEIATVGVVLVDCLTLWINNLLFAAEEAGEVFAEAEIRSNVDSLLAAIGAYPGTVILVTNEVGMGIVPDNALARHYRDLVGTCNRLIAAAADEVVLVSCGLSLFLKKERLAGDINITTTG